MQKQKGKKGRTIPFLRLFKRGENEMIKRHRLNNEGKISKDKQTELNSQESKILTHCISVGRRKKGKTKGAARLKKGENYNGGSGKAILLRIMGQQAVLKTDGVTQPGKGDPENSLVP